MIRVLILEDEDYNREFLRKLLETIPEVSEILDTADGEEAIQLARDQHPDLMLLDVELGSSKLNGLEAARSIYSFNKESYMVFVSGYSKYALDSFDVHPYGYIMKPIHIKRFQALIQEIAVLIEKDKNISLDSIALKSNNEIIHINKDEIVFIEVQHKISLIHTNNQLFELRRSLDEIEKHLDNRFLRVHRSYIVNLNKIKRIVEMHDRTYQIEFFDYPEPAYMSRQSYPIYKKLAGL